MSRPTTTSQVTPSDHPTALVPGQFSENYCSNTSEELRCYPTNTASDDPETINERSRPNLEDESSSSSSSSSERDSGGDSGSSESDSDTSSDDDSDSESSPSSEHEGEPPDSKY